MQHICFASFSNMLLRRRLSPRYPKIIIESKTFFFYTNTADGYLKKGIRDCNWIRIVTQGKGKESMDYSCLFPQCKQLLFDGLCPGRSSLLNTNSPRQLSLMLLHTARMMSSSRITDRASGSHLPFYTQT